MDQSYKSGPPTSRPQLLNLNQCPAWPRAAMGTGGVRKEGQGRGRGMAGMKSPPPGSSGAVREKKETLPSASTSEKGLFIKRPRGKPKPRLHTLPNGRGPQPQGERGAAGGSERSPGVPRGSARPLRPRFQLLRSCAQGCWRARSARPAARRVFISTRPRRQVSPTSFRTAPWCRRPASRPLVGGGRR